MKTIIITGAGLARRMIKQGERLVDIKPHRQIKNASVFVFENTESLNKSLKKYRSDRDN